uniref:Uncharacterized protein n=1 Tax=Physcomitrium patens TaxID=3218 RepID=A0A7I3ZEB9_PHYPA
MAQWRRHSKGRRSSKFQRLIMNSEQTLSTNGLYSCLSSVALLDACNNQFTFSYLYPGNYVR